MPKTQDVIGKPLSPEKAKNLLAYTTKYDVKKKVTKDYGMVMAF